MFTNTMIKRFVRVHAMMDPDVLVVEGGLPVPIGYLQILGCTAKNEEDLDTQVKLHVAEDLGCTIIEVEDFGEPDFSLLPDNIRETISADPEKWGIWYKGGHAMYSKDDTSS